MYFKVLSLIKINHTSQQQATMPTNPLIINLKNIITLNPLKHLVYRQGHLISKLQIIFCECLLNINNSFHNSLLVICEYFITIIL